MTIEQSKNGENLVIKLAGRLDTTTAPELEAVFKTALNGIKNLELDFEDLEYLSSAGLRVILSCQKVMNVQGKMVVKNVNDTIKEVFDITGFSDILTIL